MSIDILKDIDFKGSIIKKVVLMENQTLHIQLQLKNKKIFDIFFKETIRLRYLQSDFVSGFTLNTESKEFLAESINEYYAKPTDNHLFKVYSLKGKENTNILEFVSEGYEFEYLK